MHFLLPFANGAFEIPDAWLREAGATGFRAAAPAYPGVPHETYKEFPLRVVPLQDIQPPGLGEGVAFERRRMISTLRRLVKGAEMTALVVQQLSGTSRYRYTLWEGSHRFYASAALGFSHVPVSVVGGDEADPRDPPGT